MNKQWKIVNEKEARKLCNNTFIPPSKSTNIVWKIKKSKNKKWIIQCDFKYNNLLYTAFCSQDDKENFRA